MENIDSSKRVETGVLQFGGDWPGLFIRGDDCFALSIAIRKHEDSDPTLCRLSQLLQSVSTNQSESGSRNCVKTHDGKVAVRLLASVFILGMALMIGLTVWAICYASK